MSTRWYAASLLLLTSCASSPQSSGVPATLALDAQSHEALMRAVSEALQDRSVLLADDALAHSSELMIDPVRPRDAGGRLLQGRETRAPEVFRLRKQRDDCVLVHERTRREYVLQDAKCSVADAQE